VISIGFFGNDLLSHSAIGRISVGKQHNIAGLNLPWTYSVLEARSLVGLCALLFSAGCVDGPMFELKKLNPVIQSQWKKDRERGPVYSQRVGEMRLLQARLPSMPEAEQAKWTETLSSVAKTETSPELRREAVLALSKVIANPTASSTVIKLAQDKSDKVRLEAAKALQNHVTPETTQTLLALASGDSDSSVRLVATEMLGKHRTDEVKQFLAKQLSDRSPAMQYNASLALKEFTGKDFKGDVELWKRFMNGEEVSPPVPTLAETLQSYIPTLR
jgi:hypothetical protein